MTLPATDKLDLMFRAFSDRTRLRILNLLQGDVDGKTCKDTADRAEICVCDLMQVLDLPQAKVSRHLAYLRKSGLIKGRKIGRWMYYRLLPATSPLHQQLLDCLAICPQEVKHLKNDLNKLGKCACTEPGCC